MGRKRGFWLGFASGIGPMRAGFRCRAPWVGTEVGYRSEGRGRGPWCI